MIRSILVPLKDNVNSFVALSAALFLGQEDGGTLEIRGIFASPRDTRLEKMFREGKFSREDPDSVRQAESFADKLEKDEYQTIRKRFEALTGDYPGPRRLTLERGVFSKVILTRERAADLVVTGRPDEGGKRGKLPIDDDTLKILRQSHRPVMLISRGNLPGRSILLAYGEGRKSSSALKFTAELARITNARVHVLFVGKDENAVIARIKSVEDYLRPHGIRPRTLWKKGGVSGAIRETLENIKSSTLIMGSPDNRSILELFHQDTSIEAAVKISRPVVFCS